jgi:magnesium transporter
MNVSGVSKDEDLGADSQFESQNSEDKSQTSAEAVPAGFKVEQDSGLSWASGFGGRVSNELQCFEFVAGASKKLRMISRAEVLLRAREGHSFPQALSGSAGPALTSEAALFAAVGIKEGDLGSESMGKKERKRIRRYLRGFLQPRDIRQVDPAFVAKPAIWVRRNVIVFSLEHLRALIFADALLLFNPANESVQEAAEWLDQRLSHPRSSEESDMEPFEFRALESLLILVYEGLEKDLSDFEPLMYALLSELTRRLSAKRLERLRILKQELNALVTRVDGVQDVLQALLEEDEDMSKMYLTEMAKNPNAPRSPLDHEEVEQMLESYLYQVDDAMRRAELLAAAVDNTEDLVNIQLGTLRNRLLMVDVTLNIMEAVFTGVGFITGLFTMNLQAPFFKLDNGGTRWFIVVVVLNCSFAAISLFVLIQWARRARYLSG